MLTYGPLRHKFFNSQSTTQYLLSCFRLVPYIRANNANPIAKVPNDELLAKLQMIDAEKKRLEAEMKCLRLHLMSQQLKKSSD
jgi:hypothetical protein